MQKLVISHICCHTLERERGRGERWEEEERRGEACACCQVMLLKTRCKVGMHANMNYPAMAMPPTAFLLLPLEEKAAAGGE